MTRSSRRGPWLPEEDGALMGLVRSQGPNNWVRISQQIQHRSPKQCRERYHQNLKPSLKHDPISAQEGELIEQMVADMGKRWAEIARRLGNRSDNAVKNWWNGSMNRRRRNPTQISTGFKQVGSRLQPVPFTSERNRLYSNSRPGLDTRYSNSGRDQWQTGSIHDLQGYRPLNIQIPSPVQTHDLLTAGNSPSGSFDPRLMNSTLLPPSQTEAAHLQNNVSNYRTQLPPLRPGTHLILPLDRPGPVFERPLISPASSDISQGPSLRHAPSLVSDNQSMYSISPKTIPSPPPGPPVHVNSTVSKQSWREITGQQQTPALQITDHQHRSDLRHHHHHMALSSSSLQRAHYTLSDLVSSKDSRMHVSSLLG